MTPDTTIDGVPVTEGLRVWDYDLQAAVVGPVAYVEAGVRWYATTRPDGSRGKDFDAKRMWRRHPSTGQVPPGPPRRYLTDDEDVTLADGTDPWLQHPDGTVVDLMAHLARLPVGQCEECRGGLFAPTGNGPTDQGVERCDACSQYVGDLHAATVLAELIGQGVSVWYQPAS